MNDIMKHQLFFQLFLTCVVGALSLRPVQAQLTSISVETVLEHDGSIDVIPAGYTTYRIYANLTNEYDFVSAVYGNSQDPMFLNATDIFQSLAGGDFASNVNISPLFLEVFPELAYDSWFTIGAEDVSEGGLLQTTFGSSSEMIQNFQAGQGFLVADPIGGSWFNTFSCVGQDLATCSDGVVGFAGADLKVLIGQITTTGDVTGMFNVQVFVNGDQADIQLATGMTFSSDPDAIFGCTVPHALNYDPSVGATVDDLTCIFPCTLALDESALTVTSPTCAGSNDGIIQIEAVGAQGADYYYLNSIEGFPQNFGNFGSLLPGSYDVIVVDAADCFDTLAVTIPAVEPLAMTAELTTSVSCHNAADGVITITDVSGGDGNYMFGISNNPTELSTDLVWEGIGTTDGNNQTYSFTVFDGNGCTGTSEGILVTNPLPISVALSFNGVVDASCANIQDGEIYPIAVGGGTNSVGPFEFSVDGENYGPSPVTVTGGTYTVTARDPLGCTATLENEVVVGPPAILVNAAVEPELCVGQGGEVSWAPVNGDGIFTFTVNGEATTATMEGNLAPGTYTVVVTDGEGCTGEETVEVEAAVPISVAIEVIDASCFGDNDGVVTVNAEGGSGFYQYSDDGVNFIPNNQFGGFGAGSYSLFVQDQLGCVESVTANVGEPAPIVITGIVSEGVFQGEGFIDVSVTGGNLPYAYEWIGPGVSGALTQDIEGLSTGVFSIEVTDAIGCSAFQTFNLVTMTLGCTDPMACNYESGASEDDGSCDYSCLGCTNPSAFNFNPSASEDDGSCIFFAATCDFIGNPVWAGFAPGVYLGQSQVEHELGVFVNGEFVLHVPGVYEDGDGGSFNVLSWDNLTWSGLPEGVVLGAEPTDAEAGTQSCLTYSGTPFQEGVFEVTVTGDLMVSVFGNLVSAGLVSSSFTMVITPNQNGILGCTYANASNYLPVATIDDGSCVYAGCMDPEASNFQIFATTDDGSCSYECAAVEGPCMFDANNDGSIGSADLLDFLTAFGVSCE